LSVISTKSYFSGESSKIFMGSCFEMKCAVFIEIIHFMYG
jgi:hypothetical protein